VIQSFVDNRTRTYQPNQSTYPRCGPDESFDRELPAEAQAELEEASRIYRIRESHPPPPPPVYRPPISEPPPPAKRSHGAAVISILVIMAFILYAATHKGGIATSSTSPENRPPAGTQPRATPVDVRRALPVDVRRALPAVPRALPVTSAVAAVPNANLSSVRMPDGSIVSVNYQGDLSSSAALPPRGRFIGEEWSTGNTSWIWMKPAGVNFASWVDP
jgi:hypothetical protein